eukprot:UN27761
MSSDYGGEWNDSGCTLELPFVCKYTEISDPDTDDCALASDGCECMEKDNCHYDTEKSLCEYSTGIRDTSCEECSEQDKCEDDPGNSSDFTMEAAIVLSSSGIFLCCLLMIWRKRNRSMLPNEYPSLSTKRTT